MEMAANRISDLAKTIADVGTAEEELCRFEHVTYQISKSINVSLEKELKSILNFRIDESEVAKALSLFSHLWIGNLYKRHASDWPRFQAFLRREHGNLLSDSELSKVQPLSI